MAESATAAAAAADFVMAAVAAAEPAHRHILDLPEDALSSVLCACDLTALVAARATSTALKRIASTAAPWLALLFREYRRRERSVHSPICASHLGLHVFLCRTGLPGTTPVLSAIVRRGGAPTIAYRTPSTHMPQARARAARLRPSTPPARRRPPR